MACPTGALTTTVETDTVWAAIDDPTKHVIIQTAPSVRATLGECFGLPVGTNVEGKMVAALRRLGSVSYTHLDVYKRQTNCSKN